LPLIFILVVLGLRKKYSAYNSATLVANVFIRSAFKFALHFVVVLVSVALFGLVFGCL
jgi:hypothetical protein